MTSISVRANEPAFDGLPRSAAGHFQLYLVAAILRLREQPPGLDRPDADAAFPFLAAYLDQLPSWARDAAPGVAIRRWWTAIEDWERATPGHLPLRALRDTASLDHLALSLLFLTGLPGEDERFGALLATVQPGGASQPTAGLLAGWASLPHERARSRAALGCLVAAGLLSPPDEHEPIRPTPAVWAVVRGDPPEQAVGWARIRPPREAVPLEELVLPPRVRRAAAAVRDLLRDGTARAVIVRGPRSTGRRTILAALARELGLGTIEVETARLDPAGWRELGPLATALGAMPVVRADPGVGESVAVPGLVGHAGATGYTLPDHGGIDGPDPGQAVAIHLSVPTPAEREVLWRRSVDVATIDEPRQIAERYRLPAGTIRRAAPLAAANARLEGRARTTLADVRMAMRQLRSRALETLAPHVPAAGDWSDLVTSDDTFEELRLLEERCRARERMLDLLSPAIGLRSPGVRALFTGPSGTGKSLAARLLASGLEMDLHALQVSTVVDKYLGETEKNITAVFSRAAELDAVLLLDEGDALLGRRTDVATSNDRYANLQTNHLLQQLEAHEEIVVITSNAGERIDPAFQRRIDVVVEFRAPDAALRYELWRRHLPSEHDVDERALGDVAYRCQLTGGQVRNAVLHAWLLALDRDPAAGVPATRDVEAAVRREYRKMGVVCPLRSDGSVS